MQNNVMRFHFQENTLDRTALGLIRASNDLQCFENKHFFFPPFFTINLFCAKLCLLIYSQNIQTGTAQQQTEAICYILLLQ